LRGALHKDVCWREMHLIKLENGIVWRLENVKPFGGVNALQSAHRGAKDGAGKWRTRTWPQTKKKERPQTLGGV